MHTNKQTHIHTYIHTAIHTYTQTNKQTYTHTYPPTPHFMHGRVIRELLLHSTADPTEKEREKH